MIEQWIAEHARAAAWVLCTLAVADLVAALALVLAHRRRRIAYWLDSPQRLVDLYPSGSPAWVGVIVLTIVICAAAALWYTHPVMPLVGFVAALAGLIAGHVCRWSWAGGLGMVFTGQAITCAVLSWWSLTWQGAAAGLALSGVYLLWLSRFWQQQLFDGTAWTTTGRLIPIVRRLGFVGIAGTLAVIVSHMLGLDDHMLVLGATWLLAVVVAVLTVPTAAAVPERQIGASVRTSASSPE